MLVASSSRSQVIESVGSASALLTWEPSSIGVRWRPSLATAIVTHMVTRPSFMLGRTWSFDLLIRRDLRAHLLPAPAPIDLPERGSTMRRRRQR
jgi:hypothetical protein